MGAVELQTHLKTKETTVARTWLAERRDGEVFGFTDHDQDLSFDGYLFRADTGLSAAVLSQNTGLSVDNTEALGALSDDSLRDADILDGKFDGAKVEAWLVNWRDVSERKLVFRGSIGEIRRADGAFRAELRGLSEYLNQPRGQRYQKPCPLLLGESACGVDLSAAGFQVETSLVAVEGGARLICDALDAFDQNWFVRGTVEVLSGAAIGAVAKIQYDRLTSGQRVITLWEPIRGGLEIGDQVRLTVGCDKRFATCRDRFANVTRFRGFPDLPSESWLAAYPAGDEPRDGGSRR